MGEDSHEDAGGKNAAQGCDDRSRDDGDILTDEGRGIHRDRAGCHLRDGDQIREIRKRKPAVFFNHLLLNQRHGSITAAEGKGADLKKSKE